MVYRACSAEPVLLYQIMGALKALYSRYITRPSEQFIRNAALLEYPHEYLDLLHDRTANHHYGQWDEIYRKCGTLKPGYDLWLEKYACILKESENIPVIYLGCGYGNDSLYLHERGYSVISCDLSMEALKRLDHFISKPVVRHFDMLAGLPFENGSANIVIADLSIHYFLWKDTEEVVEEIKRVLAAGGHLLCRVNSAKHMKNDAGEGTRIEENYYDFGGRKKRYFNRDNLERLFSEWEMVHINEYAIERFGAAKFVWEVAIRKVS